jgi:hypothetical protein
MDAIDELSPDLEMQQMDESVEPSPQAAVIGVESAPDALDLEGALDPVVRA